MARCWIFQDTRQKQKLGEKNAPWSVGFIDPEGKRRSKKIGSKSMAEKYRRKLEGQLSAGIYEANNRKTWADFREEYERKVMANMKPGTKACTLDALKHFERICKPYRMEAITTSLIDDYKAQRRKERGKKKKSTVSTATVNKELRTLKAVLNLAAEWKYLKAAPKFKMLKEPKKLPSYVTPEDFKKIYDACDAARFPVGPGIHCTPKEWWQALLMMLFMTGWRISEPLALKRSDLDLDAGTAITRHQDNKAGADAVAPLHPIVVEHLRQIVGFAESVFPWPHHERTLWSEFQRIQKAAGIHRDCQEDHEHTDACEVYGFHDLRRAFATLNAGKLSADILQSLMRHQSYLTTKRYIDISRQINAETVQVLHVPPMGKESGAEPA